MNISFIDTHISTQIIPMLVLWVKMQCMKNHGHSGNTVASFAPR